jgi:hypothetical protein
MLPLSNYPALRGLDPWINDLIAAARVWLEESRRSPDFIAAARVEIEDLHWAILSGIARGGSIVTHADR